MGMRVARRHPEVYLFWGLYHGITVGILVEIVHEYEYNATEN